MTIKPCPILDAHNDSIILREVRHDPMDFADVDPAYHVDLPRLRKGGFSAMFVMVGDCDLNQSLRLIDAICQMEANHPVDFAVCRTQSEVRKANKGGKIALIMSIEGQVMFKEDLSHLRQWHNLGVRVASLTHGEGRFGGPQFALQEDRAHFGYLAPADRDILRKQSKGLTPFARESLEEMARLRMVCDLAHTNDKAFYEALEIAGCPVCFTHGNCYSECQHSRNCTDDMLKALAQRGGVIGICLFKCFVDTEHPSIERVADHIIHALEVMGEDHVGFGSDFDGLAPHEVPVIPDASGVPALWSELETRGLGKRLIKKITYDNFLRLME